MESAGHECVGFCEIDKYARASYKAIHNTEGEIELHNITAVSDESIRGIGSVDIICGGFPCQAFSIAGNRRGFEDTRGTLFFEICRFASVLRPKYLFLENVRGLLNHDGGATFETIIRTLDELGYDVEWQVLNSKNFGVPQNRERVFIIGHLRRGSGRKVFPISGESEQSNHQQPKIEIAGNTKNPNGTRKGTRSVVYGSGGVVGALTATDTPFCTACSHDFCRAPIEADTVSALVKSTTFTNSTGKSRSLSIALASAVNSLRAIAFSRSASSCIS